MNVPGMPFALGAALAVALAGCGPAGAGPAARATSPGGVASVPPPSVPSPSVAGTLRALHVAGDGPGFLEALDRAQWDDLLADVPEADHPPRLPCDAARLAASLDERSALLALHPIGDEVFAAIVRPGRISTAVLDVPLVAAMARRLAAWAEAPADHPWNADAAFAVGAGLLVPLDSRLAGVRRLVVAATGDLAGIPFEALLLTPPDPDGVMQTWAGQRFSFRVEPTAGTHLAWTPGGELTLVPGNGAGRVAARTALALAGTGPRGALAGPLPADADAFLAAYDDALRGGDVADDLARSYVQGRRRDDPALADRAGDPAGWAFPLLYGAP